MIRRRADSDVLLITQVDHAVFAGYLAAHLGNDRFTAPPADMIAAAAAHDAGWPLHDDLPMLNAAGQTLHVFEIATPLATRIWSASAERAIPLGPRPALLVSLHQFALSDVASRRLDPKAHERATTQRDLFELNKFQHQQIERQETLRKQLGLRTDLPLHLGLAPRGRDEAEDLLRYHFRLLTLCDRLSLQLCCGSLLFPTIEEIPTSPSAPALEVHTRFIDGETLAVEPWPFNVQALSAPVPCRRLPATPFQTVEALRTAYAEAPTETLKFHVVS
jgi:hypothetical protein